MAAAIGATVLWALMLAGGGWWAAGWGFRQPRGLPRAIGAAVLAWAWMLLGTLALGLSGWLARGPLLAWAAGGLAIAGACRARCSRPPEPADWDRVGGPWERSTTLTLWLVLWIALALGVPGWMLPVKAVTDGPIYHLYFAAQWWKAGHVYLVPTPFGETVATYLPANGELGYAALLTLWGGDRFAKIGQLPFWVLAGASVFAIARGLGVGFAAAIIATSWFMTSVFVMLFTFEANVDTILVAGYAASAYFLLRFALGDGGIPTMLLAGLAAGESWGTKATGTVFVPPLLALGAVAILARRASARTKLAQLAALGLGTALTAGYWFGRNAWLTGNPLYPLQIRAFGRVWLRGWYEAGAMQSSPFFVPVTFGRYLLDNLLSAFDPRLAPVWLAALLGAWAIGRRRPLAGWIWCAGALAVVNAALYWLLIPYRTQQRFMLPAVALATVPLAALLDRSRTLRLAAVGLLALHLITPQTWPATPIGGALPWGFSHSMRSSTHGLINIPLIHADFSRMAADPMSAVMPVANLVMGLGALAVAVVWARTMRGPSRGRLTGALTATAALIGVPCVLTLVFLMPGIAFPEFRPYVRGWYRLDQLAGPAGARIAYAGTNRAYYLMGRGLRNHVVYVNIDAHRGWRLHDYHREAIAEGHPNWPDSRPGWDRIHPDYQAWLANLAAERIDLLVVAPALPEDGLFNLADPENFTIERVWADAHPEAFTCVYGAAERDPHFRIYRVHLGGKGGGSRKKVGV